MSEWKLITQEPPPQKVVIETKTVDAEGKEYNQQTLVYNGKLWWFPDMSMYVYYTPTHWRELN